MPSLPRDAWVWMPHPAHLIVARDCRCPYRVADHSELAVRGYKKPAAAYRGHLELCALWAERGDDAAAGS